MNGRGRPGSSRLERGRAFAVGVTASGLLVSATLLTAGLVRGASTATVAPAVSFGLLAPKASHGNKPAPTPVPVVTPRPTPVPTPVPTPKPPTPPVATLAPTAAAVASAAPAPTSAPRSTTAPGSGAAGGGGSGPASSSAAPGKATPGAAATAPAATNGAGTPGVIGGTDTGGGPSGSGPIAGLFLLAAIVGILVITGGWFLGGRRKAKNEAGARRPVAPSPIRVPAVVSGAAEPAAAAKSPSSVPVSGARASRSAASGRRLEDPLVAALKESRRTTSRGAVDRAWSTQSAPDQKTRVPRTVRAVPGGPEPAAEDDFRGPTWVTRLDAHIKVAPTLPVDRDHDASDRDSQPLEDEGRRSA